MKRYKEDVRTALAKLPAGGYRTLYIDPPWKHKSARSAIIFHVVPSNTQL